MKKRILTRIVLAAALSAASFPSFAKISFADLALNSNDMLLFSAQHESFGTDSYKALFCVQLDAQGIKKNPSLLTCFPEKMELVNGGKELQIRNRYGTARYYTEENALRWLSSASEIPSGYKRMAAQLASPDGRYLCSVRQTENARGQLVLSDCRTQEEIVIDGLSVSGGDSVQAKWAPDSKVLLYEKNGSVFFVMPDAAFKKLCISESYRKIGSGSIRSVQWTEQGSIMYISGDIIFCIDENELYTRGLYASLIGIGTVKGRLPFSFDPLRDLFWTDGSGTTVAVLSRESIFSVCSVSETESCEYVTVKGFFPLTDYKDTAFRYDVFWGSGSEPLLWIDTLSLEASEKISRLYSLKDGMRSLLEAKNSIEPVLSPDRKKIAFTDSEKLCVYDVSQKRMALSRSGEKIVSAVWNGNRSVYAGGLETVRLVSLAGDEKFLFLSSACSPLWDGGKIKSRLKNKKDIAVYDTEKNVWSSSLLVSAETAPSEKNGKFRVFLGSAANTCFSNAVFVRSLSGNVKTYPVYSGTESFSPAPKRAALAFDAMENAEGISRILYILKKFGVKGTFFLNGEFIRRHPKETVLIASSGNECASLFFSTASLVENDFVIDKDFIRRGLARNEDEFFTVTGKELSLLWHAPYYQSTALIKAAGAEAGYAYVEPFCKDSRIAFQNLEKAGADADSLIRIAAGNLYDGVILSADIGNGSSAGDFCPYDKLELLIGAILNSGYEIVSVRELSGK